MTAGEALYLDHARAGRPAEAKGVELIDTAPSAHYEVQPVWIPRNPHDPESEWDVFSAQWIMCQCGVQLAKGEGCGHFEFLDEPRAVIRTRGLYRSIIQITWLAWTPAEVRVGAGRGER